MKNKNSNSSLILIISFTSNNVIFSILSLENNKINNFSLGAHKAKGMKKITATSLKLKIDILLNFVGSNKIHLKLIGLNKHKRLVLKLLLKSNLNIYSFCDLTTIPHNGCKTSKVKRI